MGQLCDISLRSILGSIYEGMTGIKAPLTHHLSLISLSVCPNAKGKQLTADYRTLYQTFLSTVDDMTTMARRFVMIRVGS